MLRILLSFLRLTTVPPYPRSWCPARLRSYRANRRWPLRLKWSFRTLHRLFRLSIAQKRLSKPGFATAPKQVRLPS